VIIGLNDSAGTGFELLAAVSLIAGAARFVRQDVYRSRLLRSIGNGNQRASLVSLTLAYAAESKSMAIVVRYRDRPARAPNAISTGPNRIAELP
jgi:hypothetical protein